MCIVGLISLFAWNAVFGAFGGVLLCIHQDLGLHLEDEAVDGGSCAGVHAASDLSTVSCVDEDESCVDIELLAELLPATRLKSEIHFETPQVVALGLIDHFQICEPAGVMFSKVAAPRAPRVLAWLTEIHLQTTVLRV